MPRVWIALSFYDFKETFIVYVESHFLYRNNKKPSISKSKDWTKFKNSFSWIDLKAFLYLLNWTKTAPNERVNGRPMKEN